MNKFKELWKNFPHKENMKKRCSNKQKDGNEPFENYCAIMLSECFIRSGISINKFKRNSCWSHSGQRHVLLAKDLASWLVKSKPSGFGKKEKITPSSFQNKLKGRTGVIYFKDYWRRGNENINNRSGDHIDLWNENEITGSSMFYRSVIELLGFVSDLNKSKEIWFWEVK